MELLIIDTNKDVSIHEGHSLNIDYNRIEISSLDAPNSVYDGKIEWTLTLNYPVELYNEEIQVILDVDDILYIGKGIIYYDHISSSGSLSVF